MDNNKKYTKADFEKMIPDYAFNKLADEEKQKFEEAIFEFPELAEEVLHIQDSFRNFSKEQYADYINSKSLNISVKVNERLSHKSNRLGFYLTRFAIPIATITAVLVFIVKPFKQYYDNSKSNGSSYTAVLEKETEKILDMALPLEKSTEEEAILMAYQDFFFIDSKDEFYQDENPLKEFHDIKDLSDKEFEELIKALENEKPM